MEHTMDIPTRLALTIATSAALAAAAVAAVASPAQAGPEYGQHVSECAQAQHLGSEHHPGTHHGATGWDGMSC